MKMQQMDIFQGLSNLELAKIAGKLESIQITAGEMLFAEEELGDCMYLIVSGSIELFKGTGQKRTTLAFLGEGGTLGEMALFTQACRSATAMAKADSTVLRINREVFQELIEEYPSFSSFFVRLLAERLVQTNSHLQTSQGQRLQLLLKDYSKLDPYLQRGLLRCAVLPAVNQELLDYACGRSLPSDQQGLSDWLEPLRTGEKVVQKDWYQLRPMYKSLLSDRYVKITAAKDLESWLLQVQAYYIKQQRYSDAVALYAELGEWTRALESAEAVLRLERPMERSERSAWLDILDECKNDLLFQRYSLLLTYVEEGVTYRREAVMPKLEEALEQAERYFTREQAQALYEKGAELCHAINHNQRALEYLQMASALSGTVGAAHDNSRERAYLHAKLSFDRERSREMATQAARFWSRGRLAGGVAILLAVCSLIYFHYAAPWDGLSRHGMEFIGIAIAAVLFWILNIVPDYIVALFMAMGWTVSGMVPIETALSGYATSTWAYMLFIFAIGAAISKSGILFRLSLHALKRFPRSYRGQLWGIVLGGAALNPLIPSSSAKVALGVPIAQSIAESMGFASRSRGTAGLGLAAMVFYGFTAPFVMTGSYSNMLALNLVSGGLAVTWLQWLLYGLPAFLVFSIVMFIWLTRRFRGDTPPRPLAEEVLENQRHILGPLSKQEIVTAVTVAGCIVLLMLEPLHGLNQAWVMLLGFAALVMTGVLDTQTIKTGIDWPFLIFIGIAFSFSEVASRLGIIEALSTVLGEKMQPFMSMPALFLLAVMIISFLVTLLVRDDPALILLMISLYPLADKAGIHPWILVFVVLLCTDPFFFSYQSPTYLTAYYSTGERGFSHRQGQTVALGYAIAVMTAIMLSIPYWKWLGLIH